MITPEDLRELIKRLADAALELQTPEALLARPTPNTGRVSTKVIRPAQSYQDWLATRVADDPHDVRSKASPAPGSLDVMDLKREIPELLDSWADYVAEELHADGSVYAVDFLLYHRERIADLSLCADMVREFRAALRRAERFLGDASDHGLVPCECGRRTLDPRAVGGVTCNYCGMRIDSSYAAMAAEQLVTVRQATRMYPGNSAEKIRYRLNAAGIKPAEGGYSPAVYWASDLDSVMVDV